VQEYVVRASAEWPPLVSLPPNASIGGAFLRFEDPPFQTLNEFAKMYDDLGAVPEPYDWPEGTDEQALLIAQIDDELPVAINRDFVVIAITYDGTAPGKWITVANGLPDFARQVHAWMNDGAH